MTAPNWNSSTWRLGRRHRIRAEPQHELIPENSRWSADRCERRSTVCKTIKLCERRSRTSPRSGPSRTWNTHSCLFPGTWNNHCDYMMRLYNVAALWGDEKTREKAKKTARRERRLQ